METKYYGINNAIIDERFDSSSITDLVIENENQILDSYLKPTMIYDDMKREYFSPRKVEIDNNLYLEILGIYEYGIIYNITNSSNTSNKNNIETSGKLIVGSNNAALFIDTIDDHYNENVLFMIDLEKNIEKEKVFTKALGEKIEIEKLYGVRTNNKFLRTLEQIQSAKEAKIIENAIKNSMRVLNDIQKEDTKEFKKILHKTRF